MKQLRTYSLLLIVILLSGNMYGQAAGSRDLWQEFAAGDAPAKSLMRFTPKEYRVFSLGEPAMKEALWSLAAHPGSAYVFSLPMPDGSFRDFRVWYSPMMPHALAGRYPGIKTFTGVAVDDEHVTAKLDYTLLGFHCMVFDRGNTAFIDPYDNLGDGFYMIHYKKDETRNYTQRMLCEVNDGNDIGAAGKPVLLNHSGLPGTDLSPATFSPIEHVETGVFDGGSGFEAAALTSNGTLLRTYRFALSANNYYCRAATGSSTPTIAMCLSTMTTSLNRVNGVYNREFSVQLNFVSNEDTLIWESATGSVNGADPFDAINSAASSCLTTNQTVVDARIGTGNYDVGHVFTTGAGGLASVGVICNASFKARGVTGSSSPVGDGFDIDYVCHEVGHEFGSSHTFNNNADGSCNGNASAAHAYEPGSGATIMDYAGICSPDNLQAHSDPYFSGSSLEQISSHISGSGGTCAVTSFTGHAAATIGAFTATYNIPYKTPFELEAPIASPSGVDTAVTYCWYQWNLGDFGLRLNQTHVSGPIFRSYQPAYGPLRVFPEINTVLAGSLTNSGERAPDTARYMTFKLAVRNIFAGNGCFVIPDDTVHINVNSTGSGNGYAGFVVTSQGTTGITYTGGTTQTVTWNRVGTQNPPVSAANVDIYMSDDGGQTWPYFVGTFANSGTASIVVPNPTASTTTARFKVKGNGNVFFNVNSNNFSVNPAAVTAPVTGTFTVCTGATTTLSDATPTGTWSSSTPSVATVGSLTGVVTGVAPGTATITYNVVSGPATAVVTVSAAPAPAAITGGTAVCTGFTTALSDATTGGAWTSTTTSVATVSASGVVSGIAAGTTVISYTVTNACGAGAATQVMTVSAPVAVAAITGTLSLCQGAVTPLADATAGGAWSSTNTAVATIDAAGAVTGVAGGTAIISYSVTNASGCVSASTAVVTVNALPAAATSPAGVVPICTGGSSVISASPSTVGYTYQWQSGGADISGATNSTFTTSTAGNYDVVITSTAGCTGTSAVVTVNVSASSTVTPTVTVNASPGTSVCGSSGPVTFTATSTNGGATPAYQWYVNSIAVGSGGTVYSYTPANGDIVSCEMTSSSPCAIPPMVSHSVTMTVNPAVTPAVSISAVPGDTVCVGQSATYNAVPVNGGATPAYIWSVNGVNVATGPSYTYVPANGDIVFCVMTGSAPCASVPTAASAPLVVSVQSPVTNTVAISASASTINPGESITFVAVAPNAGPSPVYEWIIDGITVPGATNVTFTTSSLTNGQVVHCKVTSSLPCVLPHTALSGGFTVMVTTGIWEVIGSGSAFTLQPNPNNGAFNVVGKLAAGTTGDLSIVVSNVLGQTMVTRTLNLSGNSLNERVELPDGTPAGTYMVTLINGGERLVFRVSVLR